MKTTSQTRIAVITVALVVLLWGAGAWAECPQVTNLNLVAAATARDDGPQDGTFDAFQEAAFVNNNGWGNYRIALEFDLSAIPDGATINEASLNLYNENGVEGTRSLQLHGYTGDGTMQLGDFALNNLIDSTVLDPGTSRPVAFDVTSHLTALVGSGGTMAGFNVREEPANEPNYVVIYFAMEGPRAPNLSITYTPAEGCDTTAPAITLTTPADGAVYTLGQTVNADYGCADEEGGSGVATCAGPVPTDSAIETGTVGTKTFTVTSTDTAGNPATVTHTYRVVYDFAGAGGFGAPLKNPPVVNTAKAGSTLPVKWQLPDGNGGFLCDLDAIVGVYVQQVSCGEFVYAPTDPVEETVTAGSSGLRCEDGTYIYNWKTAKTGKGKCYVLILKLADGTQHEAWFSLK